MPAKTQLRGLPRPGTRLRMLVLAFAVAGELACADIDEGGAPAADAGPSAPAMCHVPYDAAAMQLATAPPEVLILLDRSGSMDTAFGETTRHRALADLLSELVTTYGAHVRFTYQELPGRQGCAGQARPECCVSPPVVVGADSSSQAVLSAIAAAGPAEGATPTAAALQAALAYFAQSGAVANDRYVLLATDGGPSCTLAGELGAGLVPEEPACADALVQVTALAAAAIRVIVLGVGAELASGAGGGAACLDSLAHAGGVAASPGSPGYFTAEKAAQLALAMEQLFGGVTRPSCVLEFPAPLQDSGGVMVYLDDQRIPQGRNGWLPDPPPPAWPERVRVMGEYCHRIETFQVSKVVAYYKCPARNE